MGDRSDKFKFSRNDYLGEVTIADKVWHDVNIVALDHLQDLSEAWFLFPKTAINFREKAAPNNLVRMLKGWRTRIGIQRGAMTYQNEGTFPLVRHVPKLDVSPMFLKWNSRCRVPSLKSLEFRCAQNGSSARRSEPDWR